VFLGEDFKKAIDYDLFSDVKFIINQRILHGHKVIIAERCQAWKNIFLLEPNTHEFEIKNTTYDAFYAFISYLYTDRVTKEPTELLELANRYYVKRLICICSRTHVQPGSLNTDFKAIIDSKEFSDIILISNDEQRIYSHKIILTVRCEYFLALFESGMIESKLLEIPLPSLSKNSLIPFLEFIYTDSISNMEPDSAIDILSSCSLFLLERLKTYCESCIIKGVDDESVSFVYQTAKLFNSQKLVDFCKSLMLTNFSAISKTESFQQLSEEDKTFFIQAQKKVISLKIEIVFCFLFHLSTFCEYWL